MLKNIAHHHNKLSITGLPQESLSTLLCTELPPTSSWFSESNLTSVLHPSIHLSLGFPNCSKFRIVFGIEASSITSWSIGLHNMARTSGRASHPCVKWPVVMSCSLYIILLYCAKCILLHYSLRKFSSFLMITFVKSLFQIHMPKPVVWNTVFKPKKLRQ